MLYNLHVCREYIAAVVFHVNVVREWVYFLNFINFKTYVKHEE